MGNFFSSPKSIDDSGAELAREQAERKQRDKKLQDLRLQMLRRRGGGSPGLQPQPNQPEQTLG